MTKGGFFIIKVRQKLDAAFQKAGIKKDANSYMKGIFVVSLVFSMLFLFLMKGIFEGFSGLSLFMAFIGYFILAFIGFVLVFGVVLVGIINFKIYQRRKGLELILSDYLQLVAANVGAGMPIDQAMWYAVRDRFGILSLEIQTVAKKVMSGTELSDALREFSQKYDSDILNQTITLLIESLETGGEIANLVADVSWNIREGQIMKKEVSADVMSYIIFISFASLFAAPLLFALSLKLITIMSNVMGGIDLTGVAGVSSLFSFQGTEGLVSPRDFKIFTFVCLGSTSLFSSLILSSIKTGSLKNSIKYVPLFVLITYGLFILISAVLDIVFGSLIQIV